MRLLVGFIGILVGTVWWAGAAATAPVVYVPAEEAMAAIAKGNTTIIPLDPELNIRVSTGLKTAPSGAIERHAGHSHIFFILEGEGTLVTGGTIVGEEELRPGEFTGRDIEGGDSRYLTKGDVITVPVATPHWWTDVPDHVSYYAVHVYTP